MAGVPLTPVFSSCRVAGLAEAGAGCQVPKSRGQRPRLQPAARKSQVARDAGRYPRPDHSLDCSSLLRHNAVLFLLSVAIS